MAVKDRGKVVSILFILAGLVIGGLLGNFASGINGLGWLSYGEE